MNAFAPVAAALLEERRKKEHGMLFQAPMVRAILDGRKTQTRRMASNQQANRIRVGERIWVRETWRPLHAGPAAPIQYRADKDENVRWRPAIHMPRAASRITLEVTEVRFEKLHAITEIDAAAEGVAVDLETAKTARDAYAVLWDAINGAGSWETNPDIVAVSFRRLEG